MTAINATALTLLVGNGQAPETFTELGGLRNPRIALRNSPERHHHANLSHAWEKSLAGAGRQQLTVSGQGIFTDSPSEESLRAQAFSNSLQNFQIALGNGDTITGSSSILNYERSASMEGATEYQISLQSAGEINFNAAT
ncbi:MAG: phage tail tube protein [Rickettsiales bacterium]|nr:phage tail tube protein [Rickettsiales bacterium]